MSAIAKEHPNSWFRSEQFKNNKPRRHPSQRSPSLSLSTIKIHDLIFHR